MLLLITFRKGVSALIVNNKGEFLLVNLKSFEDKYFAIPGGGIDDGETPEEAIYREINEELGISKDKLELICSSDKLLGYHFKIAKIRNGIEYNGSDRYFFAFNFKGTDDDIQNDEDEVSFYKWVAYNDLKTHLLFDNQLDETVGKIVELLPEYE